MTLYYAVLISRDGEVLRLPLKEAERVHLFRRGGDHSPWLRVLCESPTNTGHRLVVMTSDGKVHQLKLDGIVNEPSDIPMRRIMLSPYETVIDACILEEDQNELFILE